MPARADRIDVVEALSSNARLTEGLSVDLVCMVETEIALFDTNYIPVYVYTCVSVNEISSLL